MHKELEMYDVNDALMGGPGLDGYAWCADVYCVPCGRTLIRLAFADRPEMDRMTFQDSEKVPQPIFFGESDTAQHCGNCGDYMYGPQDTEDDTEDDHCPDDGCSDDDCKNCEDKPIKV